jgi:hypothetical protein
MPRNFTKRQRQRVTTPVFCEVQNLESRTLPAGVVNVAISNSGNVTITGDNENNSFTIDVDEGGVSITGTDGTQIKTPAGTSAAGVPVTLLDLNAAGTASIVGKLDIKMSGGNDHVTINIKDGVGLSVGKDINVDLGKGDDVLDVNVVGVGSVVTVGGNVSIKGGDGNDNVEFDFASFEGDASEVVIQKDLVVDLGKGGAFQDDEEDNGDSFDLRANDLTVNGNLTVKGGQVVDVGLHNHGTISIAKSVSINTGKGRDTFVSIHSDAEETSLSVGKDLTITTGDGDDDVFVGDASVNIGGKLAINVGTGSGLVSVQFGEEQPLSVTGAELAINNVGKDVVITSAGKVTGEEIAIHVGAITSTAIGGKLDISTGKSNDHVEVFANADLSIGKDLAINTGSGQDVVFVVADSGSIEVVGNLTVNLGDGDDGFVGGDKVAIDGLGGVTGAIHAESESSFTVGGDLKLDGGKGADKIGLAGATIHRDLDVKGGDGNDVLGGASLQVGRDLKVDGGKGDDQIGSTDVIVVRDLKLNAGDGNDDLVSSGFIGRNIDINLGNGNDDFAVENFDFSEGGLHSVKIDFGAGNDNYAGPELVSIPGFLSVSVKNSPEGDTVDFLEIENSIIAALAEVFAAYNGFIPD